MLARIHLCVAKTNAKGGKALTTKWSNWDAVEFKDKEEARSFGRGCLCGLRMKWHNAAVAMDFNDGTTEYFTNN